MLLTLLKYYTYSTIGTGFLVGSYVGYNKGITINDTEYKKIKGGILCGSLCGGLSPIIMPILPYLIYKQKPGKKIVWQNFKIHYEDLE